MERFKCFEGVISRSGTSDGGDPREPCTDVVVVLARLLSSNKSALRKMCWESFIEEFLHAIEVGSRLGEETFLGFVWDLAMVNGVGSAIGS